LYFKKSHKFDLLANLCQKIQILAILGAVGPHFKATMVKFGMRVQTWDFLLQARFSKNRLTGYTPFGENYTKNYQFWLFWQL